MSLKILQINFKFNVPQTELEQAFAPAAQPIADTPGLRWKIWLMNGAAHEAGGVYLFDDEASLQAFLDGPIVASVGSNPALTDVSVKVFDTIEALTLVTRGPIREGTRA
ncbi:MAG: YdhR family protein [Anaerolineae bacterium]|nr:YdhR family protein [Anaerolineae bacterium]